MENQLFDWESFDIIDEGVFQFYNCTLKVQVGGFQVGTSVPIAYVNYQEGLLSFMDEEGNELAKFDLTLGVS